MKRCAMLLMCMAVTVGFVTAAGGGEQPEADSGAIILEMEWDEIVAQAREEGRVVWYQWYFQDRFREFVRDFEAEYGIEVVIPDGGGDANLNKLLAERNRRVGDIDVLSTGGGWGNRFDITQLYMGPIVDILPDGAKLRTEIEGVDTLGYAVAFWGNQTGIAYDPLRIDRADLPQSIGDVEAYMASNPGSFGFNYEQGGSGPAFIQSVSRNLLPGVAFNDGSDDAAKIASLEGAWDWFNVREDQYVVTGGNADSLTRLNDGEFVLVPAWEDHLAGLQRANEIDDRIEFYIPEFGMPGGGNVLGVPANAPHPAAALLLISWLTSADVQTQLNTMFGSAPQHPEADSSNALVPMEQRAFSATWAPEPFGRAFIAAFIDNVILD